MIALPYRLPTLVTVLVAAVLLAVPALAHASPSATAAAKRCSIGGKERKLGASYVTRLTVSGTSCRSAQRVVKAYHACRRRNGGADGRCSSRVRRYRCKERRTNVIQTQYDASVSCRRGGKRIKHTYSQFT